MKFKTNSKLSEKEGLLSGEGYFLFPDINLFPTGSPDH